MKKPLKKVEDLTPQEKAMLKANLLDKKTKNKNNGWKCLCEPCAEITDADLQKVYGNKGIKYSEYQRSFRIVKMDENIYSIEVCDLVSGAIIDILKYNPCTYSIGLPTYFMRKFGDSRIFTIVSEEYHKPCVFKVKVDPKDITGLVYTIAKQEQQIYIEERATSTVGDGSSHGKPPVPGQLRFLNRDFTNGKWEIWGHHLFQLRITHLKLDLNNDTITVGIDSPRILAKYDYSFPDSAQ